jgi:multidrug efflux pump subunit AcrB
MTGMGVSGRIAKAFIQSKLTPLMVLASLLLGLFAVIVTPREEEPQIVVPMVDVFVAYPGASAKEAEERVTYPMEKLLWEIKGVEYVYSIVKPGVNLTIVRFYVGENMEDSLVKLHNKLMSHYDWIPPGVSPPLVKPKSIDDVPILTMTLWSENPSYTGFELRRIAMEICTELKKGNDVSEFSVIGGQRRQFRLTIDPARLRAYGTSIFQILGGLQKANVALPSGSTVAGNREMLIETRGFIKTAADLGGIVVNLARGRPVYLRDVATILDGPEEANSYVFMGLGPAAASIGAKSRAPGQFEAVTIAVAKKKGANASDVAQEALRMVETMKGRFIPADVQITVTRNYGETAKEKSDELLKHMLIATISVIILIALFLGWRESLVVAVAVPVTLALTLFVTYLYGYILNRVTLFALIFSIGILVDDAIVVVENITRHFRTHGGGALTALQAVDEVGNPTILATCTVIAALLPMAFVSGLMGPYMRPIPVGATAAMLFSLLVAFIVSPWMSLLALKNIKPHRGREGGRGIRRLYEKIVGPLLNQGNKRALVFAAIMVLLALAVALIPLKKVTAKMLPFDNKSELQVIIDMPAGRSLEETAALTRELTEYITKTPEVTDYEAYIGTAAPYNFNGLVRHYYLRSGPHMADIQVNFVSRDKRKSQSHDLAKRLRPELKRIAARHGARIKLAEIPPGPPVLSTLVAEIYGPEAERQRQITGQIMNIFARTDGVVDVDWLVEDDQRKVVYEIDREKAALSGVSPADIARGLNIAVSGVEAGIAHLDREREPVTLFMQMPVTARSYPETLKSLTVPSSGGGAVPVSELVKTRDGFAEKTIYHKNLQRVTYVTGDVAGTEESPIYAILKMKEAVAKLKLPEGYELKQYSTVQPEREGRYAMKWDGEWHITYEVFRDLGIAFAAVLVIIYILVVAWFRNFITPPRDYGSHTPYAGGYPARALVPRGLLYGHLHDRFHRLGGHCRSQFHSPS